MLIAIDGLTWTTELNYVWTKAHHYANKIITSLHIYVCMVHACKSATLAIAKKQRLPPELLLVIIS